MQSQCGNAYMPSAGANRSAGMGILQERRGGGVRGGGRTDANVHTLRAPRACAGECYFSVCKCKVKVTPSR
eukprot:2632635-Pyramimonas_sp.AAC.1